MGKSPWEAFGDGAIFVKWLVRTGPERPKIVLSDVQLEILMSSSGLRQTDDDNDHLKNNKRY